MKLRKVSFFLVIFSGIFALDLFEFPMNLAGFMSIERASDACVDRINEVRDSIGISKLHQIQLIIFKAKLGVVQRSRYYP